LDNGKLIWSHKLIAWRYFSTWFVIDFVACVPFDWFVSTDLGSDSGVSQMAIRVRDTDIFHYNHSTQITTNPNLMCTDRKIAQTASAPSLD
jgi:hypothetical protein